MFANVWTAGILPAFLRCSFAGKMTAVPLNVVKFLQRRPRWRAGRGLDPAYRNFDPYGAGYGGYGNRGYGFGNEYRVGRNLAFDTYGDGGITLGHGGMQFRIGF